MDETDYRGRPSEEDAFATVGQLKVNRAERRRAKIAAELGRNREGGHRIPTWVMVAACVAIVVAFAAMVIFA